MFKPKSLAREVSIKLASTPESTNTASEREPEMEERVTEGKMQEGHLRMWVWLRTLSFTGEPHLLLGRKRGSVPEGHSKCIWLPVLSVVSPPEKAELVQLASVRQREPWLLEPEEALEEMNS